MEKYNRQFCISQDMFTVEDPDELCDVEEFEGELSIEKSDEYILDLVFDAKNVGWQTLEESGVSINTHTAFCYDDFHIFEDGMKTMMLPFLLLGNITKDEQWVASEWGQDWLDRNATIEESW